MGLLETLIVIILLCWVLGVGFHVAGGLIHLLLVVALVVFIIRMLRQ